MSEVTIEVNKRETRGKNANRRLRAVGQIPAVVYGGGKEPVPIQVRAETVEELLKSDAGENTVFLLQLAGTGRSRHAMIHELQSDALTGDMIHIDFQRIMLDQLVRVTVPIELQGEADGVRNEGGMLDFITREVDVECLPGRIPPHFDLDVSPLHIGEHVEAGQLEMPEGVTLLDDSERVIVSIAQARVAQEVEEEEEELLEAEAPEPEVVGQAKPEEAG
ncbi:MAG: 50S ribosomal protein L25 [bacterium]|nr:50S ribosomal protein L25 [bacterium]